MLQSDDCFSDPSCQARTVFETNVTDQLRDYVFLYVSRMRFSFFSWINNFKTLGLAKKMDCNKAENCLFWCTFSRDVCFSQTYDDLLDYDAELLLVFSRCGLNLNSLFPLLVVCVRKVCTTLTHRHHWSFFKETPQQTLSGLLCSVRLLLSRLFFIWLTGSVDQTRTCSTAYRVYV